MHLATLLVSGRPLLADGGMGTGLFAAGLPLDVAPESWLLHRPGAVAELHRRFVEAGADIILTCTFGANRRRLAASGLDGEVRGVNRAAADLALGAAREAGRPVVVAGAIGPTGDRPGGPGWRTGDDIAATFEEQAEALARAGVDLLWFETLSTTDEIDAAAAAALRTGLTFAFTASFPCDGRTLAGLGPAEIAAALPGLARRPLAFGANCGAGPETMLPVIEALAAARTGVALIAKPSAGLPTVLAGRLDYPVDPAGLAAFARAAVAHGASIVGGCCGATPAHVEAMRRAIDGAAAAG